MNSRKVFIVLVAFLFLLLPLFSFAQDSVKVNFFYSKTCPHCAAEVEFLDKIEEKYPEIKVNHYLIEEPQNIELLKKFYQDYSVKREFQGAVPIIFINGEFILGFDNEKGIGLEIENTIRQKLGLEPIGPERNNIINLPFLGQTDVSKYSLPVLAILLGVLDGFNICSLGALVLILGLVLVFKSKRRTLILGGIFLLTTAIIYGLLIFVWYQVFSILSSYFRSLEILVGILAIAGGGYFLWQFLKQRKRGAVCEVGESGISKKVTKKVEESFKKEKNFWLLISSVLLFAALITIIEFPCSAVVPLIFAGILADANLSTILYLSYIALFVLFYLLDEIIIFLIAVFSMKIWIASPKITQWMTLAAAIILFLLGIFYFIGL